jgi:exosortase H (IPTLxxWG-CTERM-specific)
MAAPRRNQILFLVRFFLLLAAFYALVSLEVVDRLFVAPFTHGIAVASAALLNVLGQRVEVVGTAIRNPAFAVQIQNGCNGLEAVVFLCAAILSFPATWRQRGLGILATVVGIEAVNLVRVVSLFLLGRYHPTVFQLFHLAVWQAIILGIAAMMFYSWTTRAAKTAAAS